MKLDPLAAAQVETVTPGSAAETAGFRAGDRLLTLAGQPLLSIADVQWVLHSCCRGTSRSFRPKFCAATRNVR